MMILVGNGELAGSTTARAFPALTADWVFIKPASDNAAAVYVGQAGVTVADGTTDTTTGIPIYVGDPGVWLPCPGRALNGLYLIGSNATDDLFYSAWREDDD